LFQGRASSVKIALNGDIVIGGYALRINSCAPHLCTGQGLTQDAFLMKYNSTGQLLGATSIGGTASYQTHDIELVQDPTRYEVLMTGTNYINRMFVAKFDQSFNTVWSTEIDGAVGSFIYFVAGKVNVLGIRFEKSPAGMMEPNRLAIFEFEYFFGLALYQTCLSDQVETNSNIIGLTQSNSILVGHQSFTPALASTVILTILDGTKQGVPCPVLPSLNEPSVPSEPPMDLPIGGPGNDTGNSTGTVVDTVQQGPSSGKTAGIVILVLVLFIGTGFGAWYCVRRRKQNFHQFDNQVKHHTVKGEESFVSENEDILNA